MPHLVYNVRYSSVQINSSLLTITLYFSVITTLVCEVKVKKKFTLEQTMKAQKGEQRYSCTFSLTSALDGCALTKTEMARRFIVKFCHIKLYPRPIQWLSIYL